MLVGALGVAGAVFLALHQVIYDGWTVYAAGDHFVGGEFTVVGSSPDYLGRSLRLVGLLLDRGFGLIAWAPVFLLAVAALAALVRAPAPGLGRAGRAGSRPGGPTPPGWRSRCTAGGGRAVRWS